MKKWLYVGVAALVAAGLLVLAGCGGGGGGGVVGTMSVPKISDVMTYDGSTVSRYNVSSLFSTMTNRLPTNIIRNADAEVFYRYINYQYLDDYLYPQLSQKSASFSFKIEDYRELADRAGIYRASITGTNKASASTNKNSLYEALNYYWNIQNGDRLSGSAEATRTFDFKEPYTYGSSRFAGIIKTEHKVNFSSTVVDVYNEKYTETSSSTTRVSATISFSDGTEGAIFRFSYARGSDEEYRSTKNSNSYNFSDIEVFDRWGELITTIPSQNESTWLNFAENFTYGSDLFD